MGPLGGAIDGVAGSLGMAGMAAGAGVLALGALGAASVSTAANWESLMASVSKTTGVEGSGLDQLSADLQQIRMETGATAEGIASAVTTAGSIGIPTEELASFTEVAMQMGSAFGMSAEAASEAMGKIGNVVKPAEMSWTEFSTKAGSAVNDLADSMATSEAEILTGMKHLGATMALLKPPADTIPAWTAMVATVQSLGLAGDQAGEAIQDALQYATKDLKGGISGLLGMTKEELQINLRTNAPEVMQEAAAAIAALPLEQQGEALASFGQTGQKAIALLMGDLDPASGKFEKLGDAIDTANKGWKEGASLASAYGKSQETFNASLDRLGASLDVAGQKLGTVFLPMLTEVVDGLNFGVGAAIEFADSISTTVGGITSAFSEAASGGSLAEIDDAFLKALGVDTGEKAGEQLAEGVAESKDLAAAPGDALSSDEALAGAGEAGKDLAKKVSAEMIPGIQSGMKDLDILAMINSQSSKANETFDRMFEYAGKSLRMHLSQGGSGDFWSLYSGDTQVGRAFGGDALKAFEAITGLPAPAEGAAAYYRLLGDAAKAEQIEMQAELQAEPLDLYTGEEQAAFQAKNDEIWANFGESTAQIISDNFDYISQSGSEDAKEAMDIILDAFAHPDAGKLNAVSAALEGVRGSMLDSSQADRLAEDFKAKIMPQITDMTAFCQLQGEDMGKTITSAFSDAILSEDERALITAMEPMLDTLATEAPDEFKKSGLDAISSFIGAVKSGASSAELDAMWDTIMGQMDSKAEEAKSKLQELQEGSGMFFGDFLTQEHDYTEYMTPEGGFVGPTQYYDDYIAQKQGQTNGVLAALQNIEDIQVGLKVDTTQGEKDISSFKVATEKENIEKPIKIDKTKASEDISLLDKAITAAMVKPISLSGVETVMGQIAAIDTAAAKPVIKPIYLQMGYGSAGGAGGDSGNTWGDWMPSFANEGYVASPTLAVIGDRPGGEYVVGAARFEAAAAQMRSGGGAPPITINYSPVINGSGLSQDELSRVLEDHDEKLVNKIIEAKEWG